MTRLSRADLGVSRGGPGSPFCGLLNISALHFQYEIQAFAKFKRPECTRLHLGEFHSQKFSRSSMRPPRKVRRSQSHRSKTQILFQSNHYSCTPRKRTRPIFCICSLQIFHYFYLLISDHSVHVVFSMVDEYPKLHRVCAFLLVGL